MTATEPLEPGLVEVWMLRLDAAFEARSASLAPLLDAGEIERLRRFLAPGAALQFLAGRALVRTALSRYADGDPAAWRFAANPHGRPAVAEPQGTGLAFNLSHASGLAACAVIRGEPVGVDVERFDPGLDVAALARGSFAPREIEALAGVPEAERIERFLAIWTLKEAYIKALGIGLSLPLDSFAFDLTGPSPRLVRPDASFREPGAWSFFRASPTEEHRLALAVRREGGVELVYRWAALPEDEGAGLNPRSCGDHAGSR